MKRTGIDHPKFGRLAIALDVPRYAAIGIMECLYHFTSRHAIAGDVGKWSDEEIAEAVGWPKSDASKLVDAMVFAKLVDRCQVNRLVIHDWKTHCDESTKKTMAKYGYKWAETEPFENDSGTIPGPRSLSLSQSHSQSPEPAQSQNGSGIFVSVTPELLSDDKALNDWFDAASSGENPVIGKSEANRIRVFGVAERALELGENKAAFFVSLVKAQDWTKTTQDQENRGRLRVAALQRSTGPPKSNVAAELRRMAIASSKDAPR